MREKGTAIIQQEVIECLVLVKVLEGDINTGFLEQNVPNSPHPII